MSKAIIPENRRLAVTHPEIAEQWHLVLNEEHTPNDVSSGSKRRVWWQCEKGHEWQAVIYARVRGNGCPICAGKRPIVGETDLGTVEPKIASEWNHVRNGEKTPQMYTRSSGKIVWWKCRLGHEWQAKIISRTGKVRSGCPYCEGSLPIVGETDLATLVPTIASEWNYERNGERIPEMFTKRSEKKVWWKCKRGHEWEASICNRTRKTGNGCPYCSGHKPIIGENDLATLLPEIAREWNHERNGEMTPEMFTIGSSKKVWWKCGLGHEWQAIINNRTNKRSRCPYCAGRIPIMGKTDLATLEPQLAEEWNYAKNKGLRPEMFTKASNKRVWWSCDQGHEWRAVIAERSLRGKGCPECFKIRR